jgi:hypothetical protein
VPPTLGSQDTFGFRWAPSVRFILGERYRVAEFLQVLAPLLPCGGGEDADGRQFIPFEVGNHMVPELGPLRVAGQGLRKWETAMTWRPALPERPVRKVASGDFDDRRGGGARVRR